MDNKGGGPSKGGASDKHFKAVPDVTPDKSNIVRSATTATLGFSSATSTTKVVKRQKPRARSDDEDNPDLARSPKRLRQNESSPLVSSQDNQLTNTQLFGIMEGLVACAPRFAGRKFELKEPGARLLKIICIGVVGIPVLFHLDVEKGTGSLYGFYATESCKQRVTETANSSMERHGLPRASSWTFEEYPHPNDVKDHGVVALANAVHIIAEMPLPATYDYSFWRLLLTLFHYAVSDYSGEVAFVDFLAGRYRLSLSGVVVPEGMSDSGDRGRRLEAHFWEAKRKSSEIKSTLLLLRSLHAKYTQTGPEHQEALHYTLEELEELEKCKRSFECRLFSRLEVTDHLGWRERMIADYEMGVSNARIRVDWLRCKVDWGAELLRRLEKAIEILEAKRESWEVLDQYLHGQAKIMFGKGPRLEEATNGL
ncbi:hypothetical protein QBC40DRAFT_334077 [Triangularia verruculosa]|uniref:Uncharacterized protein n=1 Tax=Triangularia verruculosa TaxID=2587418 RepID=A0AAN6XG85_9PEZI|nr:hypothetical protein QBC40DRAFT_334077 [Triangularia verruculosa]